MIINNDEQAARKKGKEFMPARERLRLVRSLRCVDAAIIAPSANKDDVCEAIRAIHPDIFAIGLDEGPEYMKAERQTCQEMGVQIVCPLGARVQSSSWLLQKARDEAEKKRAAGAAAGGGGAASSSSSSAPSPEKKAKVEA